MLIMILLLIAIVLFFILGARINRRLEDEGIEIYDHTDYSRARLAYLQSAHNFEHADPQYIDIAISDLGVSENRVNNELLKRRLEKVSKA